MRLLLRRFLPAFILAFQCLLLGPTIYPLTLVDSFYFSAVTLATVGYGDIYPVSDMAKILCIAEIGSGIVVLVLSSGILISLWMQRGTEQRE